MLFFIGKINIYFCFNGLDKNDTMPNDFLKVKFPT